MRPIAFRLHENELDLLDLAAKIEKVSRSEFLRRALLARSRLRIATLSVRSGEHFPEREGENASTSGQQR